MVRLAIVFQIKSGGKRSKFVPANCVSSQPVGRDVSSLSLLLPNAPVVQFRIERQDTKDGKELDKSCYAKKKKKTVL